jgi:starvation-inducible DNA-binding protein
MEKVSQPNRQIISENLSIYLADIYGLYLKTQVFHWNVTGTGFYQLHLLFEKQYEEIEGEIDEVAERIRALGFFIEGSFSAFKKTMKGKEEEKALNAEDMLKSLTAGHELVIEQGRYISKLADSQHDYATVDMLGRRMAMHEKAAWMLKSQI